MALPDIIRLTFKTPDVIFNAIHESGLADSEQDEETQDPFDYYDDKLKQWLTYGELITVEFDVKKRTAKVIEK